MPVEPNDEAHRPREEKWGNDDPLPSTAERSLVWKQMVCPGESRWPKEMKKRRQNEDSARETSFISKHENHIDYPVNET